MQEELENIRQPEWFSMHHLSLPYLPAYLEARMNLESKPAQHVSTPHGTRRIYAWISN